MDWFKTISRYYAQGIYTKEQVKVFVAADKITAEQYKLITGDTYTGYEV